MENAIEIKNVGKKYNIAHQRGKYVALRDVIANIIKRPLSYFKTKAKAAIGRETHEDFWALKDINLEVKKGEIIGVIGANGAGKSTLLKILSRITPPTTGEIVIHGRLASLLEVGTGFHPELTGRENIFLNGAILGMAKKEIVERFDNIVEFSGVRKFLDTPVKHYSSGMYVRLAFAVAAHMEPDILIVDEVLAVGDAEFQKKCLGKMEEVTRTDGRTVLFVSHNMAAIRNLCKRTILIEKGGLKMVGETNTVINAYLSGTNAGKTENIWEQGKGPGNDTAKFSSVRLVNRAGETIPYAYSNQDIGIEIKYEVLQKGFSPVPVFDIYTNQGEYAFVSHADFSDRLDETGKHSTTAWIPKDLLNNGTYTINTALATMMPLNIHAYAKEAVVFQVIEDIEHSKKFDFNERVPGVVRPRLKWTTE